jgi:ketosteroid isomerase-like protein
MSNTDAVSATYDAFSRGDVPAVLASLDPNIDWTDADGFPYGGNYRGHDAVLQGIFMRLGAEWDSYSAVPEEFVAEGDKVIALGTYSGKYKATGKSFSAPFAHVWTLRDGKAVKFQQYTDTVKVQEALQP